MKPRVAIATGDPAGIGPEISLKAARDPAVLELCRPVLVGDRAVLELHARACGLTLDGIELLPVKQALPALGTVAPSHGRAALAAAEKAIRAALEGHFAAVVGAPHTEAAIADYNSALRAAPVAAVAAFPGLSARAAGAVRCGPRGAVAGLAAVALLLRRAGARARARAVRSRDSCTRSRAPWPQRRTPPRA